MLKSPRHRGAFRGKSIFGVFRGPAVRVSVAMGSHDLEIRKRIFVLCGGVIASIFFVASGLVLPYAVLAIVFSVYVARTWRRSGKDYDDLCDAQRLAGLGHFSYDFRTDRLVISEILAGIFGVALASPCDGTIWELLTGSAENGRQHFLDFAAKTPGLYELEYSITRRSDRQGRWVGCRAFVSYAANGDISTVVGTIQDITERKRAEREISRLAFFDALTNLPNRLLATERLESALAGSRRSGSYGAVLFLDIDRFKTINDSFGHAYGDLILIEVARRLKSCVREVDTVARFGGDEFVIITHSLGESVGVASLKASQFAEKIRSSLQAPYEIDGAEYHGSSSIGVAVFLGNEAAAANAATLLKQADMAMYQAKDSGRNLVAYFDPKMQEALESRSLMENELRRDLLSNRLELHYQIQVDERHHAVGAEALLRWNHEKHGHIPPDKFIPVAEESSLIIDLGIWVLDSSCRQLAKWAKNDLAKDLTLAVNVSAKQFSQNDFVKIVSRLLRAYDFPPERLKLELTESVVIGDFGEVVRKMKALGALGVRLSMDDFGTGYSSLSSLKNLPIHQVKIDQSFVRDIASHGNDNMMVKTIIDLAKNFHLNVIAEGVETIGQLDFLMENGCTAYQGYYFGEPMPVDQFDALLKPQGVPFLGRA